MICDRCGVKIAPSAVRGSRFGHIEFSARIRYPYAPDAELQCFPVLPVLFIESPGGRPLSDFYDQLIEASKNQMAAKLQEIITSITDHLTPVVITAHDWRVMVSRTLARGLALEHTNVADDSPEYCVQCGYLLAGLHVVLCPGCGSQLK